MRKLLKYFLLVMIALIPLKVEAKGYSVMLSYFSNGGKVSSGNIEIISGIVFLKDDVVGDVTYKSTDTIKHINSLDKINTFTLKKGSVKQTANNEWYIENYLNGKKIYLSNSKTYKVTEIIKELKIDTSFAESSGVPLELYLHANYSKVSSSTKKIAVTGIKINNTSTTIPVGSSETLNAVITPSNATDKKVTWTSKDSTIATVDSNGKVTGIKSGTTTITAKSSNGKKATCKVKVITNSTHNVIIKFSANGGFLSDPYSKSISIKNDLIYKNGILYTFTLKDGTSTSAKGLPNNDGKNSINLAKVGYVTEKGLEWNTKKDGSGKSYSQTQKYKANDFCDSKNLDCTVTLYVNWKKTNTDNPNSLSETQKNALIETALAYYRKGKKIQYSTGRKLPFSPEEATSEGRQYTVCSAFVKNVYKETFDSNISFLDSDVVSTDKITTKAMQSDYKKHGIIKRIKTEDFAQFKKDYKNKSISEIVKYLSLETGDLLNYSIIKEGKVKEGHVVLVVKRGNNYYIYQSTKNDEKKMNYSKISIELNDSTQGSITETKLEEYMRNVIFKNPKYVTVYRPAANTEMNLTTLSKAAKTRIKYSNIEIDKSEVSKDNPDLDRNGYVSQNDIITYKIVINNGSKSTYKNVPITEKIVNGQIISASNNGVITNNQVSWNLNIDSRTTITYKVKVTGQINNKVISTGYVENIKNATIENKIFKPLSNSQKNRIVNEFNKNAKNNNSIESINKAYETVFGISPNITFELFNKSFVNNENTINIVGPLVPMVLDGYYNNNTTGSVDDRRVIRLFSKDNSQHKRINYPNENHLEIGDVLIYYDTPTGNKHAYIYTKKGRFTSNSSNDYFDVGDVNKLHNNFSNILGKQKYMVLRPSLVLNK